MSKEEKKKNQYYIKKYGITLRDYNEKLKQQNEKCWICLKKYDKLCVDHIHVKDYKKMSNEEKKKYVRGLLCFRCNVMLSKIERQKEARQVLEGIVKYFEVYKINRYDL
jgi:c-di-GMP-related signal transduction protein